MPQIGPFGDTIAAHDTSDVTPVTLRRWTAGTSDRGRVRDGSWAVVAVVAPYVVWTTLTQRARRFARQVESLEAALTGADALGK